MIKILHSLKGNRIGTTFLYRELGTLLQKTEIWISLILIDKLFRKDTKYSVHYYSSVSHLASMASTTKGWQRIQLIFSYYLRLMKSREKALMATKLFFLMRVEKTLGPLCQQKKLYIDGVTQRLLLNIRDLFFLLQDKQCIS